MSGEDSMDWHYEKRRRNRMEITKKRNAFTVALLVLSMGLFLTTCLPSDSLAGPPCRDSGWMTGGGSIFLTSGDYATYGGELSTDGRVTHGFVLHCRPRNSDNLQVVNHATGERFHLERVDGAWCSDDPNIFPNPPDANFDTLGGYGSGRCNDNVPCIAEWVFTDGGERGGCLRDTAVIRVWDGDMNRILWEVFGAVDCGNHQAHSQ